MLDNIFNQSFYRIKRRKILEKAQSVNGNLDFVVKGVKEIEPLLSELCIISSYDEGALLLHESFIDSEDYKLLKRALAVLTYLENPQDTDVIENLVEEIQKAKERNELKNIKDASDKYVKNIEDNFYIRQYKEKRDNAKSKMDIAKLHFYAYLHDCNDFYILFKEVGQLAGSLNLGNEFNRTVINNYEVINTRRILSLLLFASQPTEGNIDLLLDIIRTNTPDKYENIYKKIK